MIVFNHVINIIIILRLTKGSTLPNRRVSNQVRWQIKSFVRCIRFSVSGLAG